MNRVTVVHSDVVYHREKRDFVHSVFKVSEIFGCDTQRTINYQVGRLVGLSSQRFKKTTPLLI